MTRQQYKELLNVFSALKIEQARAEPETVAEGLVTILHDVERLLRSDRGKRMDENVRQLTLKFYAEDMPYKTIEFELDVSREYIRRQVVKARLPRRHKYPARVLATSKK